MIQTLSGTLLSVRGRIERIRKRKERIGEQNTKAVLIDPILAALGWDLEELNEVRREYKQKPQDNPVDYALFILRSPALFVEAKDLDTDLDRRWVTQTLGYATVVGVEWCVLTNGDVYRLYNAHAPVSVDEKLFREVKVSDPSQDEYTLDTLSLLSKDNLSKEKMGEKLIDVFWKAHFIDRHVKEALEDLVRSGDRRLINLLRGKASRLMKVARSEVEESLKPAEVRLDFPVIIVLRQPPDDGGGIEPPVKVQVTDLIRAGFINPPLELEKEYKAVHLMATTQGDGSVIFDGEPYNSLSTAGGMARKSVIGAPPGRPYPQTNGWTFWKYRDTETGKLEEVNHLRQRYRERAGHEP